MKYQLYGLVLESDFTFRNRLPTAVESSTADISFLVAESPVLLDDSLVSRRFESNAMHEGQPVFFVDEYPGRSVLAFPGMVQYHVIGTAKVIAERLGHVDDELIETHLLGLLSSFILERTGRLALHASAVSLQDGAIAFLAFNKGGKTSLAASFVQAGDPLLTDDILAVSTSNGQPVGAPGYPQMRVWPEHAEILIGESDRFPTVLPTVTKRLIPLDAVGPGGFCSESRPSRALFVPEREESVSAPVEIHSVSRAEAFKIILGNGFIAQIAEASGLIQSRFRSISRVVEQVPMFRLKYPSGVEHLPNVRQAILEHIEQISQSPSTA
jgi:hypothetical protein